MSKGMTITEKILADHAGLDKVSAGDLITAKVDITLANLDGSSPSQAGYIPSDYVRITLISNGKNRIKMQYLDAIGGTPSGDVIKYKRLKK